MKLLLERWREYLEEGAFDVQSFKALPQAVQGPNLGFGGARLFVVVDVQGLGPTAFYRSSGTGTPELGTENMWLPAGGLAWTEKDGKPQAWLVKFSGGKIPPEDHILHEVGVRLGKAYDKKPFPVTRIWDWVASKGYPSIQDAKGAFGRCIDQNFSRLGLDDIPPKGKEGTPQRQAYDEWIDEKRRVGKECLAGIPAVTDYGAMMLNAWLNSLGALKPDWAAGKIMLAATNDPYYGRFKDVVNKIKQALQE